METITDLLGAVVKIGILGVLAVYGILFCFYAVEAHCVNPMGCKPTPAEAAQQAETEAVMRCWKKSEVYPCK